MALSQADLQVIQTVFGKTAEELSGALSSEDEVTLGLKLDGTVYTPEQIKDIGTKNQDAWIEVGYKKIAKELELELKEGDKDVKIIAGKLRGAVEAEMEEKYKDRTPSEELKAAQKARDTEIDKYNILYKTYEEKLTELELEKENSNKFKNETKEKERDNNILSYFPDKMLQDKNDALLIAKNSITSEEIEGVTYHKINGKNVLDATGKPAEFQDVILQLVEDKGWVKGNGKEGKDQNPDRKTVPNNLSYSDAEAYLAKKGIPAMSQEGSELFAQLTLEGEKK